MRSRRLSYLIAPVALLATTFGPSAQAAVQNRIASAVTDGARTPLSGTIVRRAQRAADLGAAPADKKLESMSLRFSMTPAQQSDLTQLLADQLNPASASYHQWLTPEQFGARFGLSSADVAKVSAWLTSQGFTIESTSRSSNYIAFSGTAAQVQQAFGTSIHSLSVDGEMHIANLTDPTLPASVASVVTAITGLNDFRPKPRMRARNASSLNASYTQTIGGTVDHFIAPTDLYTIYDFNPLLTASTPITGTGVTIAVMGQTDLNQGSVLPDSNITQFRKAAGLPAINLKAQLAMTDPGLSTTGDVDEAHIDLEWSSAAAPGASIVFVYDRDIFSGALSYAVTNKIAPIITISYGGCEAEQGLAIVNSVNLILAEANAQGQTVINSSGDSGATDCDASDGLAKEGLNVDFPSSSPYVTSAGGTMFSGDVNTPATYWSGTNAASGGSALGYIPELPWNETTSTAGLGNGNGTGGGAGGGGESAFFSKPAWQTGTGVPDDSSRDVPDISLNAAAIHDGYLVCSPGDGQTNTSCTSGFLMSNGQPNVFGGTSFVAPIFAGILALVEQKIAATGGLGNVGPTLYGFLNGPTYSSVFHDINSGNNSVPCTQGTPNCPIGGSIGFAAGTGYDQAIGLGSFDVNLLVTGWSGVTPVGTGGSTIGAHITTTTLTATSATGSSVCSVSSGSLALSVAVAGSLSGTTPTGTVQFLVDNTAVTGAVVALSSGTATYSLSTSTLSSGGHNISAVYSGDGNYASSKGTLLGPVSLSPVVYNGTNPETIYPNGAIASVDIVSSKNADFSISAPTCGTNTTVQPGATASGVTFTITPANGFTGTVNLTITNNDGMAATPTLSVSPVSITTSAGVTTSFVVQASEPTTAAHSIKPELRPSGARPSSRMPWYAAGSGATVAGLFLLMLPRRRRWSALLAAVITISALTAVGCGSNTSTTGGGGGGTTPPAGTTNASPGTYRFTITAISGTLVHSAQVAYTVP